MGATAPLARPRAVKVFLQSGQLGKDTDLKELVPWGPLNDGPKDVQALVPRTFRYVTSHDKETLQG